MTRETLHLGSLDTIVDRLHELFWQWEEQDVFPAGIRPDMLNRARLVAHEWIAHLVQNANFEGRVPQIAFSIWAEEDRLCCQIADNSSGFPLEAYQGHDREAICYVMPERGMYWLIIQASTQRISYRLLGNQGYELEFTII